MWWVRGRGTLTQLRGDWAFDQVIPTVIGSRSRPSLGGFSESSQARRARAGPLLSSCHKHRRGMGSLPGFRPALTHACLSLLLSSLPQLASWRWKTFIDCLLRARLCQALGSREGRLHPCLGGAQGLGWGRRAPQFTLKGGN